MPGPARDISAVEIARAFDDTELLVRKIPEANLHPKQDGGRRVSKAAFSASSLASDPDQGMSVDRLHLLQLMYDDPSDPNQYADNTEVLMTLKVGDLLKLGLDVRSNPLPGNPAHCNVLGVKAGTRKRLLAAADWFRRPDDVDI